MYGLEPKWFHACHVCRSPWFVMLQEFRCAVGEDELLSAAAMGDEIALKAIELRSCCRQQGLVNKFACSNVQSMEVG